MGPENGKRTPKGSVALPERAGAEGVG